MMNLTIRTCYIYNPDNLLGDSEMEHQKTISRFLHDVEWILSGDYAKGDEEQLKTYPRHF